MPRYYLVPKPVARSAPALERLFQWLEAQGFRLVFWLMRRLSFRRASQLAATLFSATGPHTQKAKKVRTNLGVALPGIGEQERERITRGIFRSVGLATAELIKMPQIREQWQERVELVVDPASREYLERQSAGVYVTAHVGSWQVAPVPLMRRYFEDRPMAMVYAPESNPRLAELMLNLRAAIGVNMISSEAGLRPLLKDLGKGQSLALAVDMTRQLNERFEDCIRRAPNQWLCLKRRWPKAQKL